MSEKPGDYGDLFNIKWDFDPLKHVLKKITDRQKEMEVEIKLLKDEMKEKGSMREMEETNLRVARVFNNTGGCILWRFGR